MIVFIDSEFRCHVTNDDTMTYVDTEFFDGKCDTFIEGHRFVPSGESWTREDGKVFFGEMIAPWKDWRDLEEAQRQYEQALLDQYEQALSEIEAALGVSV